jgi:hypothetical protein
MALIQYLTRIQFDFGALALLPAELALLAVKRPLLVTDPGIRASCNPTNPRVAGKADYLAMLRAAMS